MTIYFKTKRLILRSFEDRDVESFSLYRSDPEVAKYQGWEAPYSLEQAIQFVNEMKARMPGEPGQWYQYVLEIKLTGEMVGDCAFTRLKEDTVQAEIGFTLARPFQGKGYAKEAITCLIDYLFGELKMHRIRANVDPENGASKRLLERVGLRFEGCFVESLWFKGYWASEDWYAILLREWLEQRQNGKSKTSKEVI